MSPPVPEAINRALDHLIEGCLPASEARELQEKMKADPDLLSLYLEKMRMESLLRDHPWKTGTAVPSSTQPSLSEVHPGHRVCIRQRVAWAAAAVFLVSVVGLVLMQRPSREGSNTGKQFAELNFSAAAEYQSEAPGGSGDGRPPFGDGITLQDGSVSIRMPSGVEAVLKGPSRFAIMGPNRVKLDQGSGWFRVPPEATGFAVDLPDMEVVDLGTIFTTRVDKDEQQVQVEKGLVEVRQRAGGAAQRLGPGEKLVRRASLGSVESLPGSALLDPAIAVEKLEVVFRENLQGLPDQPFSSRSPLIGAWTVQEGSPQIREGRFAAESSFTHLMGKFSRAIEPAENAVIMVSFRSVSPMSLFHSKGFAGISLFNREGELFFLGDKGLDSYSWELLSFGENFRGPKEDRRAFDLNVQGSEETLTLRYRQRTGEFEVYRGWGVAGLPLVRGRTNPGLRIDGVRIANGRGGDFSFEEIEVSVAKDKGD